MKCYIERTFVVLFTYAVAVSVPKFGLFVNLLGAVSGTVLAFVMPIAIYNKVFKDEITQRRKLIHSTLIVFGVAVGTLATAISIYELYKAFGKSEQTVGAELDSDAVSVGTLL